MQKLLVQLKTFYSGLSSQRRIVLVAAVAGTLALMVGVAWWSLAASYVEVMHSRDSGEIADVAAALEDQGIAFRISSDGRGILVLPQDEGRARIYAASVADGGPAGGVACQEIELGAPPAQVEAILRQCLEAELVRTISSLQEVEKARVHLVLPPRSDFLRQDAEASASIKVDLKPGATLDRGQVRGITALVAGATKGLKASNVTLVDSVGTCIAGCGSGDSESDLVPDLASLKQQEEARTRKAILAALTRVFGSPDDLSVGVTVDLDTRTVNRTTRTQDPDSQVLVSESVREESSNNSQPGGVPGTASNLPEEQPAVATERSSNQEVLEQRSNFAYSQVEEHAVERAGNIKRLSVGVVVNADRVDALVQAMAEGEEEQDTGQLKQQLQTRIEETVRVAVGFDEERGDRLVVSFLPFRDSVDVATVAEPVTLPRDWLSYAPYVLALVGLVLFFLMVVRPVMGTVTGRGGRTMVPSHTGELIPAEMALGMAQGSPGLVDRPGRVLAERLRTMVDNYESVEVGDLNRLVGLEEESTVHVLRRWIREKPA